MLRYSKYKLPLIFLVTVVLIYFNSQPVKAENVNSVLTLNVLGDSILLDQSELSPGEDNSITMLRYGVDYERFGDLNFLVGFSYQEKRTEEWDIANYSLRLGSMARTSLSFRGISQLRELGILIDDLSDFSTFGIFAELSWLDSTYYSSDSVSTSRDLRPALGAYYKIYGFDKISRLGYSFHVDARFIATDRFMKQKTENMALSFGGGIAYAFR